MFVFGWRSWEIEYSKMDRGKSQNRFRGAVDALQRGPAVVCMTDSLFLSDCESDSKGVVIRRALPVDFPLAGGRFGVCTGMAHSWVGYCVGILTSLTAVLSACAPVPIATNFSLSSQYKLRSVAHWRLLADDTATSLASQLASNASPAGVYLLKPGTAHSAFGEVFETSLLGDLSRSCIGHCQVALGNALSPGNGSGVIYVEYGVLRVDHQHLTAGRPTPGLFTLLGTGVWLGRQAARHWTGATDFALAPAVGVTADLLSGTIAIPTHTEVVVSVLARTADGTIVLRQDRSYYVEDENADEYVSEPLYVAYGKPVAVTDQPVDISK
jgi:hypothetical protein